MSEQTFFFYDLETSGLNSREDRIMQFAGQRTDLELNPIGEPVNILVKMTEDALPSPGAIMVTKITPQQTLQDGITEAEFCKFVIEEVFTPNTIALGFNTVRFDDEFMRAILWRNFYDPYEWQWKDGRSRWDILDLVRLTRALRPEGINWPVAENGKATNRLELITAMNGVSHEHAHDALSDVYATIAVAKLIKEKQPKLFEFLFKLRDKKLVKKYVNLDDKKPFVYASGHYSSDHNKTTVAFPLTSGRNGNVLVYDLRYDLEKILKTDGVSIGNNARTGDTTTQSKSLGCIRDNGSKRRSAPRDRPPLGTRTTRRVDGCVQGDAEKTRLSSSLYPIVKELCFNKCPAIAPISVLDENDGWSKIGLDKETVKQNLETLLKYPEFAEKMRSQNENKPDFPPAIEPEAALYDGFLNEEDRVKVAAVRNASKNQLADFHPEFIDERLPELLLHYKGRNFPETLSENEAKKWQTYRKSRLERLTPKFLAELEQSQNRDEFIAEELKLYFESLFDTDY